MVAPVNTSYCDTDSRKAAIDNLRSEGIATVIASGQRRLHRTRVSAPGCISTAITVGATDKSDVVASFSNSGIMVDVLAPGVSILSSIPGNQYAFFDGTSMADSARGGRVRSHEVAHQLAERRFGGVLPRVASVVNVADPKAGNLVEAADQRAESDLRRSARS